MANGADNNSSFSFQTLKKWSLFRAQQGGVVDDIREWLWILGSEDGL